MSDVQHGRSGASQATLVRQIVLVVILVVVAGAALYDFQIARPAAQKAFDAIQKKADEHIRSSGPPLTAADVQALLNKKPAVAQKGKNKYVEKYTWVSGLPWRTYFVWVTYTPGETPYFEDVLLNEELPEDQKPDYVPPTPPVPPLPGEPVGVGGGAGGPAAPAGGQPGGGPPSKGEGGPANQRPQSESAEPAATPKSGEESSKDAEAAKGQK